MPDLNKRQLAICEELLCALRLSGYEARAQLQRLLLIHGAKKLRSAVKICQRANAHAPLAYIGAVLRNGTFRSARSSARKAKPRTTPDIPTYIDFDMFTTAKEE